MFIKLNESIKRDLFNVMQGAACYLFSLLLLFGLGNQLWSQVTLTWVAILITAVTFSAFGAVFHRMALSYRRYSSPILE